MKNDNEKLKVRPKGTLDGNINRRTGFRLLGSEMQKSTFAFRSPYVASSF